MHPPMELERMATVSLDRLVLLMRVLGPHQMCFVQQMTLCSLQHRWQRGCQKAQRLQVVRTRRRSVFAFTGDSAACSTDENQGAHRLQFVTTRRRVCLLPLLWRAGTSLTSPSYVGDACCNQEGYGTVRRSLETGSNLQPEQRYLHNCGHM